MIVVPPSGAADCAKGGAVGICAGGTRGGGHPQDWRVSGVRRGLRVVALMAVLALVLTGAMGVVGACGGGDAPPAADILVTTTYLKDITERIVGERLTVEALLPEGVDPHSFEPTPSSARLIAGSHMVIVDVLGLEPALEELIRSSAGEREATVEAAAGLPTRPADGSDHDDEGEVGSAEDEHAHEGEVDPHFWLDPVNVVGYVENIRDAVTKVDPEGAGEYAANAEAYIKELEELDAWIRTQVDQIPPQRRLLVTNHESFGYFADRYGFEVVGTVFGVGGPGGTPSAQEMAALIGVIEATGAPSIFLETGSSEALARQIAGEAGAEVVTDLHTHSVAAEAPTYIDMMRWNVTRMVEALR